MYIVSACLLGERCKYSGGDNYSEMVRCLVEGEKICKVCPEIEGGLPVPRLSAERLGDTVVDRDGNDVTREFLSGAQKAWDRAKAQSESLGEPIEAAILKARSPSCGSNLIYDGTFTGNRIIGDGFFAELLKKNGVRVISEVELQHTFHTE